MVVHKEEAISIARKMQLEYIHSGERQMVMLEAKECIKYRKIHPPQANSYPMAVNYPIPKE